MKTHSISWWIRKANQRGLLVNNLFQLNECVWQANFREDGVGTSFGFGSTPQEALKNALEDNGERSRPTPPRRKRPRLPQEMIK